MGHQVKILESSVCIVGAGLAGLTLARTLGEARIATLLLDSGGFLQDQWPQALNAVEVIGDGDLRLSDTRHRQIGGTANLWNTPVGAGPGAKFVPLDPWDFEPGASAEPAGWPLVYEDLLPFYEMAQKICGLGPLSYDAAAWATPRRQPLPLDGALTSRVYQFGTANQFLVSHLKALSGLEYVRILPDFTAFLLGSARNSKVSELRARSRGGDEVRIMAGTYVLAAGAIENARLLLLSSSNLPSLDPASAKWIGRCFMEHPRDHSMRLVVPSKATLENFRFYDRTTSQQGTTICGRLAFATGPPPGSSIRNMSVTLLPHRREPGIWGRILHRIGARSHRGGYGWSNTAGAYRHFDGFNLVLNLEQRPHPDNRVTLSSHRDALGIPRAQVHWTWRAEEAHAHAQLRKLIRDEIEATALGRILTESTPSPDPNAHHHAGTTRMARQAEAGVVDRDARVFGLDNLFVSGASVFPTAGYANPSLTIVALAQRLAHHILSFA